MSFDIGQQIQILNPVPWIKGMVVNTITEINDDPTKFEGRIVYVANEQDKYWFVDNTGIPRKISELTIQTVENVAQLKTATLRKQNILFIVKNFSLTNDDSELLDPKLLTYTSNLIDNNNWRNLDNWLIVGGGSGGGSFVNDFIIDPNVTSSQPTNGIFKTPQEAIDLVQEGQRIIFYPGTYQVTDVTTNWAKKNVTYIFKQDAVVEFNVPCKLFDFTENDLFSASNIRILGKGKFIYTGPVMTNPGYTEFHPIDINNNTDLDIVIEADYINSPFGISVKGTTVNTQIDINRIKCEGLIGVAALTLGVTSNFQSTPINVNINRIDLISDTANGGETIDYVSAVEVRNLSSDTIQGNAIINLKVVDIYCFDNSEGLGFRLLAYRYSPNDLLPNNKLNIEVTNIYGDISNPNQLSSCIYFANNVNGKINIHLNNIDTKGYLAVLNINDIVNNSINGNIHIDKLRTENSIGTINLPNETKLNLIIDDAIITGDIASNTLLINGDSTKDNYIKLSGNIDNQSTTRDSIIINNPIKMLDIFHLTLLHQNSAKSIVVNNGTQNYKIQNTFAVDRPLGANLFHKSYGLLIKLFAKFYEIITNSDLVAGTYSMQHDSEFKFVDFVLYNELGEYIDLNGVGLVIDENNASFNLGTLSEEENILSVLHLPESLTVHEITNSDLFNGEYIIPIDDTIEIPMIVVYDNLGNYQSLNGIYKISPNGFGGRNIVLTFGDLGPDTIFIRMLLPRDYYYETIPNNHAGFVTSNKLQITHDRNTLTPFIMLVNGDNQYESLNGVLKIIDTDTIELSIDQNWISNNWQIMII